MIKRMYAKYEHMIKDIINRRVEFHKYRIKCWDYLITAGLHGVKDKTLKLYKNDTEVIVPTDRKTRVPELYRLKEEIMRVMTVRAQSMVDSWKECDKSNRELNILMNSWSNQLAMLNNERQKFDNFCFDWESMVMRYGQAEATHRGVREVMDFIESKIRLSKSDRDTIKRLGIDFRYRILGLNNWCRLRICLYFTINDIITDVRARDVSIARKGFSVPYPAPITLMAVINFDGLASAVRIYMRDYSFDLKPDKDGNVRKLKFQDLFSVTNVSYFCARTKAVNSKGSAIKFPFVEGWGNFHGGACFGSLDNDIRDAMKKLNFVTLSSLLRQWVSNYVFGETNPYSNITRMYPGIKPEYGQLGIEMGQDTAHCRRVWISSSSDCDELKCILRKGESNTAKCEDYAQLKSNEAALKKRIADELAKAKALKTPDSKEKKVAGDLRLQGHTRFVDTNSYNSPQNRRIRSTVPLSGREQIEQVARFLQDRNSSLTPPSTRSQRIETRRRARIEANIENARIEEPFFTDTDVANEENEQQQIREAQSE